MVSSGSQVSSISLFGWGGGAAAVRGGSGSRATVLTDSNKAAKDQLQMSRPFLALKDRLLMTSDDEQRGVAENWRCPEKELLRCGRAHWSFSKWTVKYTSRRRLRTLINSDHVIEKYVLEGCPLKSRRPRWSAYNFYCHMRSSLFGSNILVVLGFYCSTDNDRRKRCRTPISHRCLFPRTASAMKTFAFRSTTLICQWPTVFGEFSSPRCPPWPLIGFN